MNLTLSMRPLNVVCGIWQIKILHVALFYLSPTFLPHDSLLVSPLLLGKKPSLPYDPLPPTLPLSAFFLTHQPLPRSPACPLLFARCYPPTTAVKPHLSPSLRPLLATDHHCEASPAPSISPTTTHWPPPWSPTHHFLFATPTHRPSLLQSHQPPRITK